MPAIKHQQVDASPEVSLAEIHIPDDKDFGTGTFTITLVPSALQPDKTLSAAMVKKPELQITTSIGPNRHVNAAIGSFDDRSGPKETANFVLPETIDLSIAHVLRIRFAKWSIVSATLDGDPLASLETVH